MRTIITKIPIQKRVAHPNIQKGTSQHYALFPSMNIVLHGQKNATWFSIMMGFIKIILKFLSSVKQVDIALY